MGNGIAKIGVCFTGGGGGYRTHHRHDVDFYLPEFLPYDEGLGHSFCYVPSDPTSNINSVDSSAATIFKSISGASVPANTSTTPLSSAAYVDPTSASASGPLLETSTSFASAPLHPIPRSGPLAEPGFMSGPIDRAGFLSGPLDRPGPIFSGPLDRSFSLHGPKKRGGARSLIRGLRRAISKTLVQSQTSVVAPVKGLAGHDSWMFGGGLPDPNNQLNSTTDPSLDDVDSTLQWAQGKAGEDGVHVVVSEDHGWVFVGIYDGFNGPDATDFLLSNLYAYVQKELKGLLWDDSNSTTNLDSFSSTSTSTSSISSIVANSRSSCSSSDMENLYDQQCSVGSGGGGGKKGRNPKTKLRGGGKKWEENQKKWKCEWDRERLELDRRLKEQWNGNDSKRDAVNHGEVVKALSKALQKTEEAYLDIADKMLDENPELSLMGSCVLAMLMKGEDVYVVNVGDSRAVLAHHKDPDLGLGRVDQDLEMINEESLYDFQVSDGVKPSLMPVQLTMDHSTSVEEEVLRIRREHPDDASPVVNDRVKGSLKVTRAFGAGFLKQPKWNDALLEMFRIDYVGTSPYINCLPSLCHHRLGPKDHFLLLSSDGLYQYFTNEEAVAEVELFVSLSPDGDPAQHLVEEVLLRAAKKAGMDFHELLEISQGDRRKYHDDVSIIIISFEGRIWRSCV